MNFAAHYFTRYKALPTFIEEAPEEEVGIIVIIPCIDEDNLFHTLESLESAYMVQPKIEVIIHVNSGEETPQPVVEKNKRLFNYLLIRSKLDYYKNFKLHPILTQGTVKKKAGVGFARKTAMDEAVRRFDAINKPDGLIVSLDADTLVSKDYFREITKALEHAKADCFTFQFQHQSDRTVYPVKEINACRLYEIYLRYYRLALKTFDFPFAIHTIGSCFAIRAEAYIKLGGMPPRQGGEDFYFLQKAVKMNPVYEVKEPIVFPSPRISDRVPFGTGPSVRKIIETGKFDVYSFKLFGLLKIFYESFPALASEDIQKQIPTDILKFIGDKQFDMILKECRRYSSSSEAFVKRMLDHFDSFFIVKFLNAFSNSCTYPPIDVMHAGQTILQYYGVTDIDNLYEQIRFLDIRM